MPSSGSSSSGSSSDGDEAVKKKAKREKKETKKLKKLEKKYEKKAKKKEKKEAKQGRKRRRDADLEAALDLALHQQPKRRAPPADVPLRPIFHSIIPILSTGQRRGDRPAGRGWCVAPRLRGRTVVVACGAPRGCRVEAAWLSSRVEFDRVACVEARTHFSRANGNASAKPREDDGAPPPAVMPPKSARQAAHQRENAPKDRRLEVLARERDKPKPL
ncbi:hypothetical protein M885DRAFT_101205 [Pelagophyceae sp. CCMP2097]|nr:hypothetical protein M885DRAFT_101205 [Pelagophyceae sp. CCMP2097]